MSILPKKQGRRGVSLIWALTVLSALVVMASLTVDFGRVQIAKTQLREAADAASRAGAAQLGNTTNVQDAAYQMATSNTCLGTPVDLIKTTDVELGKWDPTARNFTILTGSSQAHADSVRVTCYRTTARQNAIPLMFGGLIGKTTCDVKASSIATLKPVGYGLVGINYIKMAGNSTASYWSATGVIGGNQGNIASNGSVTSTGNAKINGSVWVMPGATVTGITANAIRTLAQPVSYANGNPSPYSLTYNNNNLIPSGFLSAGPNFTTKTGQKVTVPGGYFVLNNFTTAAGSIVTFNGPATIYYFGTFSMGSTTNTSSNIPKNLTIVAIPNPTTGKPPGTLSITGGSNLYANIYAPQSDITIGGNGAIYGQIVGKSVTMSGTAAVYYDMNLATPGSSAINLVK